jgi:ParB/RepB/Spo0J family partition protein
VQAATTLDVVDLLLDELHADYRFNCRGVILPQSCLDLRDQIKASGLYHPIHVRTYDEAKRQATGKRYQIVSGYRRFTAVSMLGWKTIPGVVHENMSDVEARIMNLGENLTREDLNIAQEAQAVKALVSLGLPQDEIGKRLGRSRGWAQVRTMLLELPQGIQDMAAQGLLTQQQIRDIYGLPTYELQFEAAKKIKEKGPSVKVKVKGGGTSPYAKKPKTREEIFEMMDHFYEYMDPSFITRVMAWCAGEINTIELLRDFKEYLWDEKAVSYEIPESILPAMPVRTYASPDGEG